MAVSVIDKQPSFGAQKSPKKDIKIIYINVYGLKLFIQFLFDPFYFVFEQKADVKKQKKETAACL